MLDADSNSANKKYGTHEEALTTLLDTVFEKADSEVAVFIGSIPDVYEDSSGRFPYQIYDGTVITKEISDGFIDTYNTMLSNKVDSYKDSGKKIVLVDVNSKLNSKDLFKDDGLHPNDEGQEAIAQAYYDAINTYYTGSSEIETDTEENISSGLPTDFYGADGTTINTTNY